MCQVWWKSKCERLEDRSVNSVRCVFAKEFSFWILHLLNTPHLLHFSYPFFLIVCHFCSIHPMVCAWFMVYLRKTFIFNALMLEGKRYQHVLSFAYCMRVNNFCSSNRVVQFPWRASCPCHVTSFYTAFWGSGLHSFLHSWLLGWSTCGQCNASWVEKFQH